MNSQLIKVAFVGAGYMTTEHVKAFADMKNVKLCGITSRSRNRAESLAIQYGISNVTDTVAELYVRSQADLVVVAVPELSTLGVCQEVFKYPWKSLRF